MSVITNFISDLDLTDKIIIIAIAISLIGIAAAIITLTIKEKRMAKQKEESISKENIDALVVPEVEVVTKKEIVTPVSIERPEPPKPKVEEPDIISTMAARIEEAVEEPRNPVETFEDEQEEESIISYKELLAKKATAKPVEPAGNLQNIIDELKPNKTENMTIYDIGAKEEKPNPEVPKPKTGFQNAPYVSPVLGVQNDEGTPISFTREMKPVEIPKEEPKPSLEDTFDMKPIKEEIKKSDTFLASLKELRKNLD